MLIQFRIALEPRLLLLPCRVQTIKRWYSNRDSLISFLHYPSASTLYRYSVSILLQRDPIPLLHIMSRRRLIASHRTRGVLRLQIRQSRNRLLTHAIALETLQSGHRPNTGLPPPPLPSTSPGIPSWETKLAILDNAQAGLFFWKSEPKDDYHRVSDELSNSNPDASGVEVVVVGPKGGRSWIWDLLLGTAGLM